MIVVCLWKVFHHNGNWMGDLSQPNLKPIFSSMEIVVDLGLK